MASEVREVRGVRGNSDVGKFGWVRLYEHDAEIEIDVRGLHLTIKPATARRLAEHLRELADAVEFRDLKP